MKKYLTMLTSAFFAMTCVTTALAGELALGLIPTEWLSKTRPPTRVSELAAPNPNATPMAVVELSAVQVRPSNAQIGRVSVGTWTAYAYDVATGMIVPNTTMVLAALERKPLTGGHDHDDPSKPVGSLSAYTGNTGADGLSLQIAYTAPEASGEVLSLISCSARAIPPAIGFYVCLPDQYYVFNVKETGLTKLEIGATYDLVGSDARHASNHWAAGSMKSKLQAVANAYYLLYGLLPNSKLAINDISLVNGGLFDISGTWRVPHREHRVGLTADLRTPPPARAAMLRQMLIAAGIVGPLLIHTPPDVPHWHVREVATRE